MNRIITLLYITFLGSINLLKAEQLLGVNISYRSMGSNKFAVTYKVYTETIVNGKLDTAVLKPFTFKVISGASYVANYPKLFKTDSVNVGCINLKKMNSFYIYVDTIDLNLPLYASIKSSGFCRTYFACKYPNRYTGLKNIPNEAYFTYAFINTCNNANNTSAETDYYPFRFACCNQPFYQNYYMSDTTDFDSLSYKTTQALRELDTKITYSSGYSLTEPIDVYWPAGYDKLKGASPKTIPPIGFYLDSETGDMLLTPIICNSSYSLTTEIIEYKKIGGQYQETGGFLNDFVFKVDSCPNNNPPLLHGPYLFEINCCQQICFTIVSDDKQFIPPPPNKPSQPDTLSLTWNRGIAGATFTTVDPKARLKAGKFCWTPILSQVSAIPYTFTVTATDNACPKNESTTRSYSIKVKAPENSIMGYHSKNISISPNPSSSQISITSYNFKFNEVILFDITGKQLELWRFESTENFEKDLSHLTPGIYLIKCRNASEVFNLKWIYK